MVPGKKQNYHYYYRSMRYNMYFRRLSFRQLPIYSCFRCEDLRMNSLELSLLPEDAKNAFRIGLHCYQKMRIIRFGDTPAWLSALQLRE
jgi:hypothetical protein